MLDSVLNFSCNIFYFFISIFPFFFSFQRKKNFKTICLIYLLSLLIYVPLVSSFDPLIPDSFKFLYWDIVCFLNSFIASSFFFLAYEESKGKRFFYIATGYLVFFIIMAMSMLIKQIFFLITSKTMNGFAVILMNLLISTLVSLLNFFVFRKSSKVYQGKNDSKYLIITVLLNVVFTAILANIPYFLFSEKDALAKITFSVISILFGYISLFSHSILIKKESEEIEKEKLQRETLLQEKVLNEKMKQYEIAQNMIDLVNAKYHDLKHHFGDIGFEKDSISQQIMHELASDVDMYDTYIHTGNEALDVILTELNMTARKKGVLTEIVVDGSCLSFLSVGELYSIFGNTIDNSLNYLKTIDDPNKKFIRINARKEKNISIIHVENYYEGEAINNKIVKTSSNEHGFGLKSIKLIARKYNGEVSFKTADNLFKVNIILFEPSSNM